MADQPLIALTAFHRFQLFCQTDVSIICAVLCQPECGSICLFRVGKIVIFIDATLVLENVCRTHVWSVNESLLNAISMRECFCNAMAAISRISYFFSGPLADAKKCFVLSYYRGTQQSCL